MSLKTVKYLPVFSVQRHKYSSLIVSYNAVYMLYVIGVRAVTCLDNILYVVCWWSSTIRLYNTDTLSLLDVDINVTGMRDPCDIVVCRHDRQLYVAERYCTWRVSVDDHSYVKWMNTQFNVGSLSMTSRHLLVTSSRYPTVRQYSTTNKQLLCVVQLPQDVKDVWHAVETTHGTFVVCHRGTSQGEYQFAVSELLRVCHVLQH